MSKFNRKMKANQLADTVGNKKTPQVYLSRKTYQEMRDIVDGFLLVNSFKSMSLKDFEPFNFDELHMDGLLLTDNVTYSEFRDLFDSKVMPDSLKQLSVSEYIKAKHCYSKLIIRLFLSLPKYKRYVMPMVRQGIVAYNYTDYLESESNFKQANQAALMAHLYGSKSRSNPDVTPFGFFGDF